MAAEDPENRRLGFRRRDQTPMSRDDLAAPGGPEDDAFSPKEVESEHERGPYAAPPQADDTRDSGSTEAQPPDVLRDARPERRADLPASRGGDAGSGSAPEHREGHGSRDQPDDPRPLEDTVDRLVPLVLARIENQQHLHLPISVPSGAALAELKTSDPKAYRFWFKEVKKQLEHERAMERAPFEVPAKVSRSGQVFGLAAVVVMAALVAFVAYLDHPWLAGVLGVLDFVGLAAVFARSRPPE